MRSSSNSSGGGGGGGGGGGTGGGSGGGGGTHRSSPGHYHHLQYVADYGFQVAIKLSLLAQHWDGLLGEMIVRAAAEVDDEAAYKKQRLAQFRTSPHKNYSNSNNNSSSNTDARC